MNGKILIRAELKVLTGLHIGASDAFSPIGAVDSPVVRDPLTMRPIIPGSSLKGKLRSLLARSMNEVQNQPCEKDAEEICRLFGCHTPEQIRARLQFADAFVCNADKFAEIGLTEVKFENGINRINSVANPRQIERVIPGVKFNCCIAYDRDEPTETEADFAVLAHGMKLLQLDYLGGHGTRGSGRISFEKIDLQPMECDLPAEELERLNALFDEVKCYELLHR